MLSFSCVYWQFVYLLWRNVSPSVDGPFKIGLYVFLLLYVSLLYILNARPYLGSSLSALSTCQVLVTSPCPEAGRARVGMVQPLPPWTV